MRRRGLFPSDCRKRLLTEKSTSEGRAEVNLRSRVAALDYCAPRSPVAVSQGPRGGRIGARGISQQARTVGTSDVEFKSSRCARILRTNSVGLNRLRPKFGSTAVWIVGGGHRTRQPVRDCRTGQGKTPPSSSDMILARNYLHPGHCGRSADALRNAMSKTGSSPHSGQPYTNAEGERSALLRGKLTRPARTPAAGDCRSSASIAHYDRTPASVGNPSYRIDKARWQG